MLTKIPYAPTCRAAAWNLVRRGGCNRGSMSANELWPSSTGAGPVSAAAILSSAAWERTAGDGFRRNGKAAGKGPGVAARARSAPPPGDHGRSEEHTPDL